MSLLMDKAQTLIDHASRVLEARSRANRRDDYDHRRQGLKSLRDRYRALAGRVDLLVRENVAPRQRLRAERQGEALAHVEGFLERFVEDSSVVIDGDHYALLDRDLTAVEQLTLQLLRTAWQRHFDEQVRELREDALEVQLASPDVAERLRSLHARLRNLRGRLPENAGEIQSFRTLVDQFDELRQEAWRSVLGDAREVPLSVEAFVQSVQSPQGCTLDTLTPEILAWLEERGLAKRFQVQLA